MQMSRTVVTSVVFTAALALPGCWTAPVANVQPKGEPRLIQSGIGVRSVKNPAIVQSVSAGTRTIVVLTSGEANASTYKVGPKVSNFDRIKAGDKVELTVAEDLAVYLLRGDQLPGPSGAHETIAADARVLSVDSSYRLLMVQYANGQNETFKVGLRVELPEMQAGDSIVTRTGEVVAAGKEVLAAAPGSKSERQCRAHSDRRACQRSDPCRLIHRGTSPPRSARCSGGCCPVWLTPSSRRPR